MDTKDMDWKDRFVECVDSESSIVYILDRKTGKVVKNASSSEDSGRTGDNHIDA